MSSIDKEFASQQALSNTQMQHIISTYEKVVGFESPQFGWPIMKANILAILPSFENDIFSPRTADTDGNQVHNLSQNAEDRDLVLECTFLYWKQLRLERGISLLRPFWRRYQLEDMDHNAIFRSRYVEKMMRLRNKTRGEHASCLKMKQLLKDAVNSLH